MGRYTGSQCRLCRREQMKLFLKGTKCVTEKCTFAKRTNPPGMHVRMKGKPSYYALQLREKQKVKRIYGMLEKQFRRFFQTAVKAHGVTGRMLIQLLERRIDNVVFRSMIALSRNQARQMVRHGFIFIKNRRVDIPSYIVAEGEVIEIRVKAKMKQLIKDNLEAGAKDRSVPAWLEVDNNALRITVARLPEKEDMTIPVNEQLIVELYSK